VPRPVDHHGLRPLLAGSPYANDVEATVTKEQCRAPSETSSGSGVEHFNFDSRVRRSLGVVGRITLDSGLLVVRALIPLDSIIRAATDDGGEKKPAPDLHRKLFQSATVSGKM
jgi:hypothetical protein